MARKSSIGRLASDFWVPLIVSGIVSAAILLGSRNALAQTSPTPGGRDGRFAVPDIDRGSQPISFFASERSAAAPNASESRQSAPSGNGSLILMELRTQRGTAKSARPLIPDLDPRLKPLGW
ncbi:MAG TPA: hypothetical protein VG056_12590 [Pirellulales bacterium]|jgi:hypothetical protein|nr:hypothetical protein [Pirellulales bacterium]